ncbi:MAG: hypothetical protein DRO12_04620 [Thermoprotei archaeon]|nr:MAG: hypothetical protein DRO12_04620 [Thermoprotei archaeon]
MVPGVLKNIKYSDPHTQYRGQKILEVLRRVMKSKATKMFSEALATDVFYSFYLPFPTLIPIENVPLGKESHYLLIKTLLGSDETRKIRPYTVANNFTSTLVSVLFLQYFAESFEQGYSREQAEGGEGREALKDQEEEKNRGRELKRKDAEFRNIISAVHEALKRVSEDTPSIKSMEQLIQGKQAGVGHTLDLEEDAGRVIKLIRSVDLRELLRWLERIPDIASIVKRRKMRTSRGEIEGYTVGSDVERLVPTELAYPDLYFYSKFADSTLLLYEKFSRLTLGPVYVLIDKSGSMEGDKIKWAKATALALFIRSRIERRPFYIRFFDSEPFSLIKVSIRTKPGEVIKLMEYVARVKSGGGTDISKAILTACTDIQRYKLKDVSDVILITDGEDRIAKSLVRRSLHSVSARLISVMIMGDNTDLKRVSDRYFKVVKLDEKEMLKVVEA